MKSQETLEFLQERIKENFENMDPESILAKVDIESFKRFCGINLKKKNRSR